MNDASKLVCNQQPQQLYHTYKSKEDENNEGLMKPPIGVGTWWSSRFCLAYLGFFGFVNVYALRVNLSVAIVSMVNSSYQVSPKRNGSDVCPASSQQANDTGGEFNWDGHQQGLVLGAFFYGYILTQLPGGYLAGRFGGKLLFGGGILWTALLTLLTPIVARTSFPLLIVLRVLEGVGEGVTFPAMHAIWGVWAPPLERSRLVSLTYAGCHFGTVLAQPIAGVLCSSDVFGGWPSVFYIFGGVAMIWCSLWFVLAKNYPRDSSTISREELMYIETNVKSKKSSVPVPWKKIALSKSVWAISIAHFCNNWGFYTLLTSLPLYLKEVLRFDITQNGFVSALPYLIMWITINLSGYAADKIREKGYLNTTQTRKLFNGIAFIGPAIFLVATCFVGCDKVLAVAFISIATGFNGLSFPGFSSNHIDIASRYSGILMGISNTWGTIPGFVTPLIVGALTSDNASQEQWSYVFYISAAVYVIGTIAYTLMGTGVERSWNKLAEEDAAEKEHLLVDDQEEVSPKV